MAVSAQLLQGGVELKDEYLVGGGLQSVSSHDATVTFDGLKVLKKPGAAFTIVFWLRSPFSAMNSSTEAFWLNELVLSEPCLDFSGVFNVVGGHRKLLSDGSWGTATESEEVSFITSGGPWGNGHVMFDRNRSQFLDGGSWFLDAGSGVTVVIVLRFTGEAAYNETVLSFGNAGGNIPSLHLARTALSGGITFWMSDKRGTVRDCYIETAEEWIVQDWWITIAVRYNALSQLAGMWVNNKFANSVACSVDLTGASFSSIFLGRAVNSEYSGDVTTSFLNADVAGAFVTACPLGMDAIGDKVYEFFRGTRVPSRVQYMEGENVDTALLAIADGESQVIPTSSMHVSAELQTQNASGPCSMQETWINLANLNGTTKLVTRAGYVVFTDLRIYGIASPCLRIQFSTQNSTLRRWTRFFQVFPFLRPSSSSREVSVDVGVHQGTFLDTTEVISSNAKGFKVVAELQTCTPQCQNSSRDKYPSECVPWKQTALSPVISTGSSLSTILQARTLQSNGTEEEQSFLEVHAAAIIVKEISQNNAISSALNVFTVKIAFNVNITANDGDFIVTLAGLRSSTTSNQSVDLLESPADSNNKSQWFRKAVWRQGGGRLECFFATDKNLTAGRVIAFRFSLLNEKMPRKGMNVTVSASGQHLMLSVIAYSPQPLFISTPRLQAFAAQETSWPSQRNKINVLVTANTYLERGSLVTLFGFAVDLACPSVVVLADCGRAIPGRTRAEKSDLLVAIEPGLRPGENCSISVQFMNAGEAQPETSLSMSFLGRYWAVDKQAVLGTPFFVEEPKFIVKEYGIMSTSISSVSTVSLTLMTNVALSGGGGNEDENLLFRVFGLRSETPFPVSVFVHSEKQDNCQIGWHKEFKLTGCLSLPSCRRNTTCIQAASSALATCGNASVVVGVPCMATGSQTSVSPQASQSFVLRGRLPAGVKLVLEWNITHTESMQLNLTCSMFGERIFELEDVFQNLHKYPMNADRVPDFVKKKIGQTSSWPGSLNSVHITLIPGHNIPMGSLVTISGFASSVFEGLKTVLVQDSIWFWHNGTRNDTDIRNSTIDRGLLFEVKANTLKGA